MLWRLIGICHLLLASMTQSLQVCLEHGVCPWASGNARSALYTAV